LIEKSYEKSLVEQAIKQDKQAFTSLYECHMGNIYRHVFFRTRNQNTAEDITQEVFLRAWKWIPKYQYTGKSFLSWLVKIADNLLVDNYKRYKSSVSLDDDSHHQEIGIESSEDKIIRQVYINEALSKLKEAKRKVIVLRFMEGFTFREVGKLLNKSEGAIRVIQHRALSDLREILGWCGEHNDEEKISST
jgi:RNA polymerase sigma-70 factor (ECF subfamily)